MSVLIGKNNTEYYYQPSSGDYSSPITFHLTYEANGTLFETQPQLYYAIFINDLYDNVFISPNNTSYPLMTISLDGVNFSQNPISLGSIDAKHGRVSIPFYIKYKHQSTNVTTGILQSKITITYGKNNQNVTLIPIYRGAGILKDNLLYVVGDNTYGQLVNGQTGTTVTSYTPSYAVDGVDSLFSFGTHLGIGIKSSNGEYYVGGYGGNMGLGFWSGSPLTYFTPLSYFFYKDTGLYLENVSKIDGDQDHLMILLNNGDLYSIGYNGHGEVGTGDTTAVTSFVLVNTDVVDVYCGAFGTIIKKDDGNYYCIGYNAYGRFGLNDGSEDTDILSWTLMNMGGFSVAKLVLGPLNTFFLTPIGTVVGAGNNSNAIFGTNGATSPYYSFHLQTGSVWKPFTGTFYSSYADFVDIKLNYNNLVLKYGDDLIVTTGYPYNGMRGLGSNYSTTEFIFEPTVDFIKDPSDSLYYTTFVYDYCMTNDDILLIHRKDDGKIYARGLNSYYQVNDGTTNIAFDYNEIVLPAPDRVLVKNFEDLIVNIT